MGELNTYSKDNAAIVPKTNYLDLLYKLTLNKNCYN